MSDNYRNRLESYLASMLQAKRMLSMGIITPEDYADIDTIMNENTVYLRVVYIAEWT